MDQKHPPLRRCIFLAALISINGCLAFTPSMMRPARPSTTPASLLNTQTRSSPRRVRLLSLLNLKSNINSYNFVTNQTSPRTTRSVGASSKATSSLRTAAAAAGNNDDKDGDGENGGVEDDNGEELVGMDTFLAQKAEKDRQKSGGTSLPDVAGASSAPDVAGASAPDVAGGNDFFGLRNGSIFPSDVLPSSGSGGITLQGAKLEPGHSKALIGFWQLYGSTPSEEDLSGRLVLRADGHVVGGPTVRKTTEVEWSDPEGLKPVGGKWSVYVNEKGQSRLELTLVLSFKKAEQLEMDGVVMMVEGWNNETQQMEAHPQIFGSVFRRLGKTEMEDGEGDFSMIKTAKEGKLVATVGSQQGRIW